MKEISRYNDLRIPDYALSYLINDDDSGIDEQDKKNIDSYMAQYYQEAEKADGHVIFATQEDEFESYFTWNPEFGLACNVVDCVILIVRS